MDIQSKLNILAAAARYDVSCSSSGSERKNNNGLGNAHVSGICHSWSSDGRCISLLKILMTNMCSYDCAYCINRRSSSNDRAIFTPDEIVNLTINFYKRNYIEGLFLSSAVYKNPDFTMELMLQCVVKLRMANFNGYIHLKAIPGADKKLIDKAGLYVDRMSVNIELPSRESLKLLAPQKSAEAIFKPMDYLNNRIIEIKEDKKTYKKPPLFLPAGQTTQLIIGATNDHDLGILRLSEGLYNRYSLKRVYYSAYIPVSDNPNLPALLNPPLKREHRLYQADWLLRFYGFKAGELLDEKNPDFDIDLDPKSFWALKHMELFPVEINSVDYTLLLRIPGIGVRSALKIRAARRVGSLSYDDLKKFGVVLKRAKHFITCQGKYYGTSFTDLPIIRQFLLPSEKTQAPKNKFEQLSIYNMMQDNSSAVTGEL
ncbi:radical SAM superfamily protein [Oxobacter pfennigii]|uniref:Radical SAM superfamily protein n=1 Tax=Oxobacter pfennigii TaxID=36849 RepID=A0A0P8WRC0_9CLOT|nr:putative DNA modification/repair radical SAM protein [Oxobacter pfennigii]KPU45127.1 radical SAM superfamily protein [Oxobacter pfennigii]